MLTNQFLETATKQLKGVGISSARLDAELIVALVLKTNRTKLLTNPPEKLTKEQLREANNYLKRRTHREPLAYIRGCIEFYGLDISVTPEVLIPRPETETMVEQAINVAPKGSTLIDVGTGSGAIALAIKANRPDLEVQACDISPDALTVAKQNAKQLKLDINVFETDILDHKNSLSKELPWRGIDTVVANLPYVRKTDERSPETVYEPSLALFAEDNGLRLYRKLLSRLPKSCNLLIVESNPDQVNELTAQAKHYRFKYHKASEVISIFARD